MFVDGCFWHSCPIHGSMPVSNQQFWRTKLQANVARDREQNELLAESGWTVLRIWEHEPLEDAVAVIAAAVTGQLGRRGS